MRIEWSAQARSDLRHLRDYIALDSPNYARQIIERIIGSVEKLSDHPRIGRRVPEANREDVRELIYQGYRIIYLLQSEVISVVTVIHGSRNLESQQNQSWNTE